MNLTLTDAANLKIEDSEIGGHFTYDGPGFILEDVVFDGDAHFTRDTTANEQLLGSNIYHGDATFINKGTGYLMFRTSDTYHGDATFIATSTGQLRPGNYSTNTFKGNIHANDPAKVTFGLDYAGSKVVLNGDGTQTISADSAGTIAFRDLEINKSQGSAFLERNVSILDSLILTDGIIYTDTFFIEIKDNAKAVGAADTSYVEGKVKKTGNEAFTYPVGKNGHYRPMGISAPSSTSAEFIAEYFESNSDWVYDHSSKDATIDEISRNEYWGLDRTATTNTVDVTLYWDTITACHFDSIDSLRVASWDGVKWKNLGNGGTTGDTNAGSIITNSASSNYFSFALGTTDFFECLLCNEATILPSSDSCYGDIALSSGSLWFMVEATNDALLEIEEPGVLAFGDIDSIYIYEGNDCQNLYLVESRDVTDPLDYFQNRPFPIQEGNTYFIQVVTDTLGDYFDLCLRGGGGPTDPITYTVCNSTQNCNYVCNPSFEDTTTNVIYTGSLQMSQINRATPWYSPIQTSPDYFNAFDNPDCPPNTTTTSNCLGVPINLLGHQPAYHGHGYAGIIADDMDSPWREYLQQQLRDTITAGKYRLSFFVSRADTFSVALNGLGMLLSQDAVTNNGQSGINATPQLVTDTMVTDINNWIELADTVSLGGGETHLTIGCFFGPPDLQVDTMNMPWLSYDHSQRDEWSYYYIDQVSVIPVLEVSAAPDTICYGHFSELTAQSVEGSSYLWSTGDTTKVIGVVPDSTTEYTVEVTTPLGCTLYDTVTVVINGAPLYQCCRQRILNKIYDETYTPDGSGNDTLGLLDDLLVSNYTISNDTIVIDETFTVNGNLTLDSCVVIMQSEASIHVNSPYTLTITDSTHIYACDSMWQSIVIPAGAHLDFNQGSKIEDGINAVVVTGGTYTIDNAIFNRNYVHLSVIGSSNPAYDPGDITNSQFNCKNLNPFGLYFNCRRPYEYTRTHMAVSLAGRMDFEFGSVNNPNLVEWADFGIYSSGREGWFYHSNTKGPQITVVGDTLNKIDYGIVSVQGSDVLIEDNYFTEIDEIGIVASNHESEDIDIFGNEFTDRVNAGIVCFNNRLSDIFIKENDIDFAYNIDSTGYGITIWELVPNRGTKVNVRNNTITKAVNGIWTNNLLGTILLDSLTSTVYVGNNDVTQDKPTSAGAYSGILLNNTGTSLVIDNDVSQYYSNQNWWEAGIRQDGGNTTFLFCNNTHDIGCGMFISGDVRPFELLVRNTFSDNERAGLLLNHGAIGVQGGYNKPNLNEWDTTTTWNASLPSIVNYDYTSPPINPFLSLIWGAIPTSNSNPWFPPTVSNVEDGTATDPVPFDTAMDVQPIGCPYFYPPRSLDTLNQMRDSTLLLINSTDSLHTLADTTQRWQVLYGLYQYLPMDTTLLNADTVIQNFYDSCDAGNMGQLHRLMEALGDFAKFSANQLDDYQDTLNDMTADNQGELRIKQVLEILLDNIEDDTTITGTQITTPRDIAELCPTEEGQGVYMARAYLLEVDTVPFNASYWNDCEAFVPPPSPRRPAPHSSGEESGDVTAFRLYPNPNGGRMQLAYSGLRGQAVFELHDLAGRTVARYTLNEGSGLIIINEEKLQSGMYTYQVTGQQNVKLKTGKVVIHR